MIPNYSRYEVDASGNVTNKQTKSVIKSETRANGDEVFRLTSDAGKRDYVLKSELIKLFETSEPEVKNEPEKKEKTSAPRELVRIHINFKLSKQKYDEAINEIQNHKKTKELNQIAENETITKTERVRKLHAHGISKNAICILAKCRTGFIYNSLNDYMTPYKIRKKEKQHDQKKGETKNEQ